MRDRAQNRKTMTDCFVARNGSRPVNLQGRPDFHAICIKHMAKLAWSLTLKNSSCYLGSMTFKQPRSFELTIPSRLEEMEAVHELIAKAVKEYKLSDELA